MYTNPLVTSAAEARAPHAHSTQTSNMLGQGVDRANTLRIRRMNLEESNNAVAFYLLQHYYLTL